LLRHKSQVAAGQAETPERSLWANRGFRYLWIGQAISEAGSRITRDGLPMAAVTVLGATPTQMGFLTALGGAATLLFGMFAGVWVDRVRRRPVLIAADVGRAVVIGSIPLAAYYNALRMPQLYVVTALAGVLTVLFDVAYQAYVPELVARDKLIEANSRLALTGSIAEVLGPAATGLLVRVLTAPIAILIDAVSFVGSAISVLLIAEDQRASGPRGGQTATDPAVRPTTALSEIRDGWQAVIHQPVLRVLAFRAITQGLCHGLIGPLYVYYAMQELGLGPLALGIVIAIGGVSNLTGALIAPAVSRRFGVGRTLFGSAIVLASSITLIGLAHPPRVFAIGCLVAQQLLGDAFYVITNVTETSLRQSIVPDRLLGRVGAVFQLLTRGIWPIGALASGVIAGEIGVRGTFLVAACGMFASAAWLLSPVIYRHK
jgi:MFS family permease